MDGNMFNAYLSDCLFFSFRSWAPNSQNVRGAQVCVTNYHSRLSQSIEDAAGNKESTSKAQGTIGMELQDLQVTDS
jgi:hypothetical protein